MEVTNELIQQWDPQIRQMARKVKLENKEFDDVCQELRKVFLRIVRNFNPDRGVAFHTYLYRGLNNTLASLIKHQNKMGLSCVHDETVNDFLTDDLDAYERTEIEIRDYMRMVDLSPLASQCLEKLLAGYNKASLNKSLGPWKWGQVRNELRTKFKFLLDDHTASKRTMVGERESVID